MSKSWILKCFIQDSNVGPLFWNPGYGNLITIVTVY